MIHDCSAMSLWSATASLFTVVLMMDISAAQHSDHFHNFNGPSSFRELLQHEYATPYVDNYARDYHHGSPHRVVSSPFSNTIEDHLGTRHRHAEDIRAAVAAGHVIRRVFGATAFTPNLPNKLPDATYKYSPPNYPTYRHGFPRFPFHHR